MTKTNDNKKRYLVTGGCGFIGSHLVDSLVDQGHEIVVLDDLSTGKRENLNPKAGLIVGDITNYGIVEEAFENIHGCFHLAAIASVEKSTLEWGKTHTVNATGAVNIFQAARRNKRKIPVVYTSSAAVYGDCKIMPISENLEPNPLTAYGADKYSCDLHGRVAWNVHGVRNIGLRPFNVYGPRQEIHSPYSGVISIFTNNILRGNPIKVFGDGGQLRDFVYVADAVKGFLAAMENLQDPALSYGHEEINLCTGVPTSINKLIETIADISGCNVHRINEGARRGDIRLSVGDPSHLWTRLKVRFDNTLFEGLKIMLGNFALQENRQAG